MGIVMNRQQLRKALIALSFIALPVTLFTISPILVVQGAFSGIATGSMILFSLLFPVSPSPARGRPATPSVPSHPS